VIPARYASSRLPGKPLIAIKGLPLVMWAYRRARDSDAFDRVIVATDDQRILDAVRAYGGEAVMTSTAHRSGTDRVLEAVSGVNAQHIVNLQGDEPEVPVKLLRDFAESLNNLDDKSLLTCVSNATIEEASNPDVVKAVLAADGRALYFSRAAIPFDRDGEDCRRYKHIGIYGFTRASLERFCGLGPGALEQAEKLEQLRALEANMTIRCLIRRYDAIGIDTPRDLELFRRRVGESG
jgi:3-deoxy-manno-octulosonate cytidylyltransferase (CMP-KDO synthetase)